MDMQFIFILALVTLLIFAGWGIYDRAKVRKAWKRGEKTDMGLAEERRRNGEQAGGHELRDKSRTQR